MSMNMDCSVALASRTLQHLPFHIVCFTTKWKQYFGLWFSIGDGVQVLFYKTAIEGSY